jgi:RNA polymerase sigma-70 factor (ECF subfamily)
LSNTPSSAGSSHLAIVPDEELSDAQVVAAALAGKRWAEELLYRRHVPSVSQTIATLLGRMSDCEDVVQDTFVEALSELPALRDHGAFRGWLMRIAVNKCHRRFRKRKLLRALGLDRAADDVTLERLAAPVLSAEHKAELARIDAALQPLPERERSAWILRHVHGHELTEVAELSGVSLATVKRLITRAQDRVARHISIQSELSGKGGRRG